MTTKCARLLVPTAALLVFAVMLPLRQMLADSKPVVRLNAANAAPRQLEDTTEKAIARDYGAAWQALEQALAGNSTASLNDNFIGYALETLSRRVKDQ
ncbi:MAG TPA: hypothetical protein VF532_21790, partial [Candidatus Angelobacter sp.]